jgi:hypothetical protein
MWPRKNGGSWVGTALAVAIVCNSAFPLWQRQLCGRSLAVCHSTVLHTGVACAHVANYPGRLLLLVFASACPQIDRVTATATLAFSCRVGYTTHQSSSRSSWLLFKRPGKLSTPRRWPLGKSRAFLTLHTLRNQYPAMGWNWGWPKSGLATATHGPATLTGAPHKRHRDPAAWHWVREGTSHEHPAGTQALDLRLTQADIMVPAHFRHPQVTRIWIVVLVKPVLFD